MNHLRAYCLVVSAVFYIVAGPQSFGLVLAKEAVLRIPVFSHPPSRGNPFVANGVPSSLVWFALFDPLIRTDVYGKLEPSLALRWEALDKNTWRFYLRRGIAFSNGEEFDASAVKTTLDWLHKGAGRGLIVGREVSGIKRVDVLGPYTLDIVTVTPDAILPKRLTSVMIVAPKAWIQGGVSMFSKTPVGTGPFRLVSWNKGGAIEVVKNQSSWRPPHVQRILFYQVSDASALVQALQSGQMDLATTVSPEAAVELEASGYRRVLSPTGQVMALGINVEGSTVHSLRNVKVRRALNMAINRAAITNIIMLGTQKPASQPGTPLTFGYNPSLKPFEYNPVLARTLLKQSGFDNNIELEAEVVVGSNIHSSTIYQMVQQDFRKIGVNLKLRSIVFSDWIRKYSSGSWASDFFSLAWNSEPYYDVVRPMEYYSCKKAIPFFCDNELASQLDATGSIFDQSLRLKKLQDLSRIYRNLAPSIFIIEISEIAMLAEHVKNYNVKTRVPVYEDLKIIR